MPLRRARSVLSPLSTILFVAVVSNHARLSSSDQFFSSFRCARHFKLLFDDIGLQKRCVLQHQIATIPQQEYWRNASIFAAPVAGEFGSAWGLMCGKLWSGHLGYWWYEEPKPRNKHDVSDVDTYGYGSGRCPIPLTKETQSGISICTVYLFHEEPGRSTPVTRLYPICTVEGGAGDRKMITLGYGIENIARGEESQARRLSSSFSCPRYWVGRRGSACTPPADALSTEETPRAHLRIWSDLHAPLRDAALVNGREHSQTVLITTASYDYLDHARIWSLYHRRRGMPVIIVALDLLTYFALRAEMSSAAGKVYVAFHKPFSGRRLEPWCVERYLMPIWRQAHHAKTFAALFAASQGMHVGVLDLDVFLDEDSPDVDWARLAESTAIAHSGTFDFFFGYTSASEPARQMWENIHLSVLHGSWDQTAWGWFGDRFRRALNEERASTSESDKARHASGATEEEGSSLNRGKREVLITGPHEHLPMIARLPGNITIRRMQNREGSLSERLKRALLGDTPHKHGANTPSQPPFFKEHELKSGCSIRWSPELSPCGSERSSGAPLSQKQRPERWRRLRLCLSILTVAARAVDQYSPGTTQRAVLVDKTTWTAIDGRSLRQWFDIIAVDEFANYPAKYTNDSKPLMLDIGDIAATVANQQPGIDGGRLGFGVCNIHLTAKALVAVKEHQLWLSMAAVWENMQNVQVGLSAAHQMRHVLTPPLPGRRIQGHTCLPPPFHRDPYCLAKCRNEYHACATFLGDTPLPAEKCPNRTAFTMIRCQHNALTPSCSSSEITRKPREKRAI